MQYNNPYIEQLLENVASPFYGLNTKERETIVQHHSIAGIKKGGYILRQGENARGVIYLAAGKAKVYRSGVAGREHILRLLNTGDLIGLQDILTEGRWSASSIALENSFICIIDKNPFLKILHNNAELSVRCNRILSGELCYSYDKMVSLSQKHVRGRLAESLLTLVSIYGYEADGTSINASLSRSDIAHLSNMTPSNAIRTLSNLAQEGIIKIKGRRITLLNPANLKRISDQA